MPEPQNVIKYEKQAAHLLRFSWPTSFSESSPGFPQIPSAAVSRKPYNIISRAESINRGNRLVRDVLVWLCTHIPHSTLFLLWRARKEVRRVKCRTSLIGAALGCMYVCMKYDYIAVSTRTLLSALHAPDIACRSAVLCTPCMK